MSDYWKSTPKYWCKHCSTFVKDTPFEKKQHEETGRHQGQLKRFLRGIQNDHAKAGRETQRAKAEVDRLNKVVGGTAASGSVAEPSVRKSGFSTAPQASVADRKKQLAQLVEMGVAVPDEYRADMALAGDWKITSQRQMKEPPPEESLSIGVRKRKFEGQEEEEEAGATIARRGWGSTTKRYPRAGAADDLDALFASVPVKKKEETDKKEEEEEEEEETIMPEPTEEITTTVAKNEDKVGDNKTTAKTEAKEEEAIPFLADIPSEPAAPVFRKRRQKILLPE